MTSFILIILSLYHLVVPSIFQLESPSLRAAAVLKHLLCCSSLTRLRGGWNPRCTKQLSWKQIIVIWAASIVDKDDSYNKCCAAHQSIPSRKKWSSQIIIWSLFWRAAISTTSWRLVFALALSSLERPPIYGQYFCNLVNSKHQQVVARPWWPWPYLKFFQQPSNLLAFNNKTQLYKAIWCEKLVWSC